MEAYLEGLLSHIMCRSDQWSVSESKVSASVLHDHTASICIVIQHALCPLERWNLLSLSNTCDISIVTPSHCKSHDINYVLFTR